MCAPNSATLCFNDVNEMHYALNESVRRTCAGAAAVRGQLQGHKKRCERQLWEVKWDRDVCVCSLPGGLRD